MAGSFNKVILLGNLTRDIELRHLPQSNNAVANIGLAVNRRFRTAEGENREETTFVDCEAYGRTAETMSQYLRKGRPVFIEGRLKLDQWEDKDGGKRSKLKVVVENFQFVDSRADADTPPGPSSPSRAQSHASGGATPGPRPTVKPQGQPSYEPVAEEDIPF